MNLCVQIRLRRLGIPENAVPQPAGSQALPQLENAQQFLLGGFLLGGKST